MQIAIFDMDGTLIDSAKDISTSINAVRLQNHNLENLSEDFVVDVINRDRRNLAELFYGTETYEQKDKTLFEEHYYEQCVKNVYLYDGVKETLEQLKQNGVKLSVATNAPSVFAKRMLAKCGVYELFDYIVGADNVEHPKPEKDMLEFILNKYNYTKEDTAVMFGDNNKDMMSASNANISAYFVTWGFSPVTNYKMVISSPKDIIKLFKGTK